MAGGGSYATSGAGVTCYAESTDGIHWTKPTLSVVAGTNIVDYNSERDASVIWLDKQESNASKRYKMFLVARESGKWRYHYKTSRTAKSGVPQFNRNRLPTVQQYIKILSETFGYIVCGIMFGWMRISWYVRGIIMKNTDPEAGTKKAEALLSAFWFGPWANEQHHTDYPNIAPAIYNQDATPYESIMLGFFSVWQGPENDVCASDNVIKRNQLW